MRAHGLLAPLLLVAAAAAGCVSLHRTPPARFFVLHAPFPPPSAVTAEGGIVGVLPVRLPGHLERPQLVAWAGPGELRVDEFARWGEPLDAGITRSLAQNLQAQLPDHFVVRAPWRARVVPRCRVVVELGVFGLQPGGDVLLEGRWALLPADEESPIVARSTALRRGPLASGSSGVDPVAQVDALSALVADLAAEIAAAVRALPEPAAAAPPPS